MAERKRRMGGRCVVCGAATSYARAGRGASGWCQACVRARGPEWSAERVVERIQRWVVEVGSPPSVSDWVSSVGGDWPTVSTVQARFGSWSGGLRAAGFEPYGKNRSGRPAAARELRESGLGFVEIAERLGYASRRSACGAVWALNARERAAVRRER